VRPVGTCTIGFAEGLHNHADLRGVIIDDAPTLSPEALLESHLDLQITHEQEHPGERRLRASILKRQERRDSHRVRDDERHDYHESPETYTGDECSVHVRGSRGPSAFIELQREPGRDLAGAGWPMPVQQHYSLPAAAT
jgi:hypothetical protein